MQAIVCAINPNACGILVRDHVQTWLKERDVSSLCVGLFASLADEISTHDLDRYFKDAHATRAVACAGINHDVCFVALSAQDFAHDRSWNDVSRDGTAFIDVTALDIIFVPGRAFDLKGRRLGRGHGCFDRGLAKLSHSRLPLLVGLAFDEQIVDDVPTEVHDICVDYICTPHRGIMKPARDNHA